MKKFIGYFIIGATTKQDAVDERGLLLWSSKKPNAIIRFFNKVLLNIQWIDKTKVLEEKGVRGIKENNTQMFKVVPKRENKYEKPRDYPRRSPKGDTGEA